MRDAIEISHGLQRGASSAYTDIGPADDAEGLRGLIAFPIRDEDALLATIDGLYDPASPQFRQYLSVADWNARHAPSVEDVELVSAWLREQGFDVPHVASNRLFLEFTGTAGAFTTAFEGELHMFGKQSDLDFWTYGTLTDLRAPKRVADRIASIVVADPLADTTPLSMETGSIDTTPPPDSTRLTVSLVGRAYGTDRVTANGAGVTIGVVAGASFKLNDVQSFWQAQGITRADPEIINVMERPSTRFTETTLDVEWSGGLAPGAQLIAYLGPDSHEASLVYTFDQAIADGRAQVITDSFAHREDVTPKAIRRAYHVAAEMAAAIGTTVVAAAGDSGEPDVPSSSPFVTSVGGTVLVLDAAGNRTEERAWSSSGAGESLSFEQPWWQADLGVSDHRAVSDIALAATRYWAYAFGDWKPLAGTSFASPVVAGLVAVLNSARIARGKPVVGFLNSTLYTNTAVQAAFHDVVAGGTTDRPGLTGWDYPTGWGAPDAAALLEALP